MSDRQVVRQTDSQAGRRSDRPALCLAGGLVQGVSEDGVLLGQSGELATWSVLQLLLETRHL